MFFVNLNIVFIYFFIHEGEHTFGIEGRSLGQGRAPWWPSGIMYEVPEPGDTQIHLSDPARKRRLWGPVHSDLWPIPHWRQVRPLQTISELRNALRPCWPVDYSKLNTDICLQKGVALGLELFLHYETYMFDLLYINGKWTCSTKEEN